MEHMELKERIDQIIKDVEQDVLTVTEALDELDMEILPMLAENGRREIVRLDV